MDECGEMSKVSIIMPLYNQRRYVEQAINSVVSQTFTDWELIIIDDCSTDGGNEIAWFIAARYYPDKMCVFINDKNYGVSKARNRGLQQSKGDYIAFLDADDYWEVDKLAKQVEVFERRPSLNFIHTGVKTVASINMVDRINKSTGLKLNYWDNLWNNYFPAKVKKHGYFNTLTQISAVCWSSIMVTRELAVEIGFDEGLFYQNEDWLFVLKCAALGEIHFLPEKLTNYRLHEGSYTAKAFLFNKDWDVDTAKGQVYDRCLTYVKKVGGSLMPHSYRHFNNTITSRQVIKKKLNNIVKYKKIAIAKIKNFYHKNKHYLPIKDDGALDLLILHVTDSCNLKCSHCFVDSAHGELQDIDKIIDNAGVVNNILLTGGEPFLRSDIAEIISTADTKSNVWINTNGFNPLKIKEELGVVSCGMEHNLTVSVSIDGFEKTHNKIRGNDKSFERALDTLRVLQLLRKSNPRMTVMVNTTVMPENMSEIIELGEELAIGFDLDYHNFEIVRGDSSVHAMFRAKYAQTDRLFSRLLSLIKGHYPEYHLVNDYKFRLQLDKALLNIDWPFPCLAGDRAAVVYANGDIAPCEILPTRAKLKDFGWDIKRALKGISDECSECSCTHGCWLLVSMIDFFSTHGWKS